MPQCLESHIQFYSTRVTDVSFVTTGGIYAFRERIHKLKARIPDANVKYSQNDRKKNVYSVNDSALDYH